MSEKLDKVRDTFLNMIADAVMWEVNEDVDTDSDNRPVDMTVFTIVTRRQQLEELAEALGIPRRFDECVKDAIDRAVEGPVKAA